MSSLSPGGNGPSRLDRIRYTLSGWKPRLVKSLLAAAVVLQVAGELIGPLGNALKGQQLLGGSFASLIAFVLYDAISESESKEIPGVYVFADRNNLLDEFREAFEARRVTIEFSGFTMETLIEALAIPLRRMADNEVRTVELKLCLIIAHLNLPMGLPGGLVPAPRNGEPDTGKYYFRDSPENRERMREEFTKRNWARLKVMLNQVQAKNPHMTIFCEIRESPQIPERKIYILNNEKIFTTPYGIEPDEIEWQGGRYEILDTPGFAPLYGRARYIGWDLRSRSRSTRQIAEHHMECHQNLWKKLADIKPERPVIRDPRWTPPRRQDAAS
ncbi:hypothetical protein [Streptomyces sasae]|uniref:hypothetical protein n=1 Tax=Streptomyces sasae TaxID=1266772 RepID=UPI0029318F57|nr:hypothetical protein [Streptomyces sasae]